MSYKNSIKLLTFNFSLVWKQVLYTFIFILLFGVLSYQVAKPVLVLFEENGIADEFENYFSKIYELSGDASPKLLEIVKHILSLIADNFSKIYGNLISLTFTAIILPYIVFQMSKYNLTSIVFKKVSMNMNANYMINFISTLKYSFVYALTNLVLSIPFLTAKVLLFEIFISVSGNIIVTYLGLICLSALYIVINSIKMTLFSSYSAIAVESDMIAPRAFGKSVEISVKNFWNILSTSILLLITIMVANGFVALFTFFAGLIITIPASMVLKSIFSVVVYFNKTGHRYYIGNNLIFNPSKYAVKREVYQFGTPQIEIEPVEKQVVNEIIKQTKK